MLNKSTTFALMAVAGIVAGGLAHSLRSSPPPLPGPHREANTKIIKSADGTPIAEMRRPWRDAAGNPTVVKLRIPMSYFWWPPSTYTR